MWYLSNSKNVLNFTEKCIARHIRALNVWTPLSDNMGSVTSASFYIIFSFRLSHTGKKNKQYYVEFIRIKMSSRFVSWNSDYKTEPILFQIDGYYNSSVYEIKPSP